MDTPVGTIIAFAGEWREPDDQGRLGWMLCDGRTLDKRDFPELFRAIGTLWGGSGDPHFHLPNLIGMFLRGNDRNKMGDIYGLDPDSQSRVDFNGNVAPARVGSKQDYATGLPRTSPFVTDRPGPHGHGGTVGDRAGTHSDGDDTPNPDGVGGIHDGGDHDHRIAHGGDSETRPVNVAVNYLIQVRVR